MASPSSVWLRLPLYLKIVDKQMVFPPVVPRRLMVPRRLLHLGSPGSNFFTALCWYAILWRRFRSSSLKKIQDRCASAFVPVFKDIMGCSTSPTPFSRQRDHFPLNTVRRDLQLWAMGHVPEHVLLLLRWGDGTHAFQVLQIDQLPLSETVLSRQRILELAVKDRPHLRTQGLNPHAG